MKRKDAVAVACERTRGDEDAARRPHAAPDTLQRAGRGMHRKDAGAVACERTRGDEDAARRRRTAL
jgi:hypothetical protein